MSIQTTSVSSTIKLYDSKLVASQGLRDKLAEACQEVDTHSRMKAVCIDAADGKKANFCLPAEWDQCCRTDFIGFLAKQEIPL